MIENLLTSASIPNGNASLNVWERQFSLFPIGAKQYLVVMAQSDKGLQTEPEKLLCVVRLERRR